VGFVLVLVLNPQWRLLSCLRLVQFLCTAQVTVITSIISKQKIFLLKMSGVRLINTQDKTINRVCQKGKYEGKESNAHGEPNPTFWRAGTMHWHASQTSTRSLVGHRHFERCGALNI
jgi:hypothetical protein